MKKNRSEHISFDSLSGLNVLCLRFFTGKQSEISLNIFSLKAFLCRMYSNLNQSEENT